jgi:phosphoribosylformimino-5-aminoimidazole carboxamide ribotide isomerase
MSLTLFPAIDLKDGYGVRLERGEMDRATIYAENPGAQAAAFVAAGFQWIHVVDLNGAFAGRPVNQQAVRAILAAAAKTPVQLGGGIRDLATIETWLATGITRVILGSIAARNPGFVREAAAQFPGRIVAGIDAKSGLVATEGWAQTTTLTATDLATRLADSGIAAIIYTDIARDGMKTGLNLEETEALANAAGIPVIASGGVGSLADIVALKAAATRTPNVIGAIVGRALYDGSLNPAEALAAC